MIGSWRYQAVEYERDGEKWIALHEVYVGKKGKIISWTEKPVEPIGNDICDMVGTLEHMHNDCRKYPVIKMTDLGKKIK